VARSHHNLNGWNMLNKNHKIIIIIAVAVFAFLAVAFVVLYWYLGNQSGDKNTKEFQKYQTVQKEQTQKVEADKAKTLPAGTGEPGKTITPLPAGSKTLPALPN